MTPDEKHQLELLRQLSNREDFKEWVKVVVEPTILSLEDSLNSNMESLSEVELRARLKHLNSLRYLFKDVFAIVRQRLSEEE